MVIEKKPSGNNIKTAIIFLRVNIYPKKALYSSKKQVGEKKE